MTITLRPSDARGHADHGWLNSRHSFSFADYHDPRQMGFRALRVINDDVVRPSTGFATHGHRDMEIVTYVVRGALEHKDTTGGTGILRRGDVQRMSAGTGVRHSEYNASRQDDVRLLQIWILPNQEGLPPSYEQATFPDAAKRNRLFLIAAPGGVEGALPIHQDVRIHASVLDTNASLRHTLVAGRGAWIQVVDGSLSVNGQILSTGDGAAIEAVETLTITAQSETEFLLFDLA
ncbi:putative Quercetin 2,3-dioxygenase [Candidatus Terasakiella magnetica]|nr:putative Quercetin 2,3-dioxygenase [Candidatus Terasakiella magnetica]